jgi:hypothetical protein
MAKKLGCASCGGTKKMKEGGINKPMTYAKRQAGDSNQHMGIFGMPNIGQGAMDGKTGQMKNGGSTSRAVQPSCKNGYVRSADGGCVKARPIQFKTGGSTFGMLSVKAGIDKNPKPTAADRIAGAKKTSKKK